MSTTIEMSPAAPAAGASRELPKIKFKGPDGFFKELRKRVDAYFETTGRSKRDVPQMYLKTATILAWFAAAYLLLMFVAVHWYTVVPLAIVLGVAVAAIGFNIQHDGGHRAYSEHGWINRLMALTLDLMGGSSYIWDFKHNSIHHTYTNIDGHDDDINVGPLARLAPTQKRLPFHRLQGVYLWFLYGFLAIKWHFIDDFWTVSVGKIGGHKIPRPKGKDLAVFIVGKVFFFSMALVIPMLFHPALKVLAVYAMAAFTSGVVMSIVFQLAHCVEEAQFPEPVESPTGNGQIIENAWAVHQIETTVDFARRNWFLCWLLGGLNFQVEHHLFHKICHIHYPALSKVVEGVCKDFGVKYNAHKSFFAAVASHAKYIWSMGQPSAE